MIDVPSAGQPDVEISLSKPVAVLPTVSIVGKERNRDDRSGFGERQREGHGFFIGEEDLRKHADFDLESVLARAPGLTPKWGRAGRYYTMRGNFGGPCQPNYFIDGVLWMAMDTGNSSFGSNTLKGISNFYRASDLRGIEVYRGLGSIPQRFDRGNACGAIVIWTK